MRILTHIKNKVGTAALAFAFAVVSVATPWLGLAGTVSALAPTTPVNVRLMTGGNSVAVLWEPAATGDPATSYKVYRGGVLKATVSPANNNLSQGNTQRWLDTTVVNATAYSYQVSAVNADGESVKTVAKNITHSTAAVVPTVTIDASTPATLTTFANNTKAFIQAWYPKFVNHLGNPAGTDTTLTIKSVSGLANTAQHSGSGLIEYNQEWAIANAANPAVYNIFLHEMTHAIQLSGTGSQYLPWAHEGMATYMQNYVFGDNNNQTISLTGTNETWLRGYEYSAYMLNHVTKVFNKPNFVKDFDASFNPTIDLAFFRNQTNGLSIGDVWKHLGGRRVSSNLYLINVGSWPKCLELTGAFFNPPAFTPPKLGANCDWNSTAQQWVFIPDDTTGTGSNSVAQQGEFRVLTLPQSGTCLDVTGSGTTAGTTVTTYGCNGSVAQKWVMNANGTVTNPNSGMCLQPIAKGTAAGTAMEIAVCDGTAIQNWNVRPMGTLKSQYTTSCASTSVNPVQTYACTGIPNQQMTYVQPTPGATTGQIKNMKNNICMQPVGASTAVDAKMEFVACAAGNAQQWQWQSDMKLKNIGSGLCLTMPAAPIPPEVVRQFFQSSCAVEASPASLKKFDFLFAY